MQDGIFAQQKFYNKSELKTAIRTDLIGELEAIDQYNAHINATDNQLARAVWTDIMNEEKTHVGELLTLLHTLDPTELQKLKEGQQEVEEIMRELGI